MPLPLAGLLGRFTSQTASETLGFGVGVALAEALRPEANSLGQDAWAANPTKAVDAELAAAIVAEAVEQLTWGQSEAAMGGIDGARFAAMVGEALNAPAVGELLRMRRRGTINEAAFAHGLRKAKLEEQWDTAVAELAEERIDPAAIAVMVQRGVLRLAGLLPVGPPTDVGRVPPMPEVDIDPIAEAAAAGIDRDRLAAMTRIVGLPPGPTELMQLLNRREIDEADFYRGIAEGNTRNEWGSFLIALRRRLLTPHEYAEARLRGWIDEPAMIEGAGLSGMTADDTRLLSNLLGRPLSFRQAFIGLRRGGVYDGPTAGIDPAFLHSLRQSSVRPEWYHLAWAQRFTYPSPFVLRALTSAGELTATETETILLYSGWEPGLAKKVSARWAAGGGGKGKAETLAELEDEYAGGYMSEAELRTALGLLGYSGDGLELLVHLNDARRVKRWREKVVDAIAAAHLAFKIDDTTATAELAEAGVAGEAATLLLNLWGMQRRDTIRALTPAQIKKAHKAGLFDEATALSELEQREMTAADAATYLGE